MGRKAKAKQERKSGAGITRRDFMKVSAAAGAALGFPALLAGCSGSKGMALPGGSEMVNFFFDLSHLSSKRAYFAVVGGMRHFLSPIKTEADLWKARQANPMLSRIPANRITHAAYDVPFPRDSIGLCYVMGKEPDNPLVPPSMATLFVHLPSAALENLGRFTGVLPRAGLSKFKFYGVDPGNFSEEPGAYALAHSYKGPMDQATALVFGHLEMITADPTSAAYIQQSIIEPDGNTYVLADSLYSQGSGWATNQVITDPTTGKTLYNSQGEPQVVPLWSTSTSQYAGAAIASTLTTAKNDPTLGANMTGRDPDGDNSDLQGKIWTIWDGQSSVTPGGVQAAGVFTMAQKFISASPGLSMSVSNLTEDRTFTLTVKNSYLRYLGLYIRYLDTAGNPILRTSLPQNVLDSFPDCGALNSDYDSFAMAVNPEFAFLGIPIKSDDQTFTVVVPEDAGTVVALAAGIGSGDNPYPQNILQAGVVTTAIINLAMPAFFLALNAGASYKLLVEKVNLTLIKSLATVCAAAIFGAIPGLVLDDPKTMVTALVQLAQLVLTAASQLPKLVAQVLGKPVSQVTDSIPIIGTIIMAISSAGMIASLAETIEECVRSPKVYEYDVTFTQQIVVTVSRDPNDFKFPATAATYEVMAVFDNGSCMTSGVLPMPGQPYSDPIPYTFGALPMGGMVKFETYFRADTGWCAGQGATAMLTNDSTLTNQAITIKENKVPLTANTYYSHEAITELDATGALAWKDTNTPPTTNVADLSCENVNGDLCQLVGITVSQASGAAGYAWKAYSNGLAYCKTQAQGQMYAFGSLSLMQNPQAGHGVYPCGFSEAARVVFDLAVVGGGGQQPAGGATSDNYYVDTSYGLYLVRQIRLAQETPPDWDAIDSNKCFGQFYTLPDALLFHPSRKLISIDSVNDKFEVLDLPETAVPDADAILPHVYSATGTREGLMKGPVAAGVMPHGEIVILEQKNMRLQAFDIFGNPAPIFTNNQYYVPLKAETLQATYLDLAVEATGFIYVLSYVVQQSQYQYRLDIYTPEGDFLSRTTGVNADKLSLDFWRNAYTLNYQPLKLPNGNAPDITEPTVSIWIPSTP
ncbi:MAG: twin-arginine translocation signal domain-containing protein [Thermodesulfobacteriota bacterium]